MTDATIADSSAGAERPQGTLAEAPTSARHADLAATPGQQRSSGDASAAADTVDRLHEQRVEEGEFDADEARGVRQDLAGQDADEREAWFRDQVRDAGWRDGPELRTLYEVVTDHAELRAEFADALVNHGSTAALTGFAQDAASDIGEDVRLARVTADVAVALADAPDGAAELRKLYSALSSPESRNQPLLDLLASGVEMDGDRPANAQLDATRLTRTIEAFHQALGDDEHDMFRMYGVIEAATRVLDDVQQHNADVRFSMHEPLAAIGAMFEEHGSDLAQARTSGYQSWDGGIGQYVELARDVGRDDLAELAPIDPADPTTPSQAVRALGNSVIELARGVQQGDATITEEDRQAFQQGYAELADGNASADSLTPSDEQREVLAYIARRDGSNATYLQTLHALGADSSTSSPDNMKVDPFQEHFLEVVQDEADVGQRAAFVAGQIGNHDNDTRLANTSARLIAGLDPRPHSDAPISPAQREEVGSALRTIFGAQSAHDRAGNSTAHADIRAILDAGRTSVSVADGDTELGYNHEALNDIITTFSDYLSPSPRLETLREQADAGALADRSELDRLERIDEQNRFAQFGIFEAANALIADREGGRDDTWEGTLETVGELVTQRGLGLAYEQSVSYGSGTWEGGLSTFFHNMMEFERTDGIMATIETMREPFDQEMIGEMQRIHDENDLAAAEELRFQLTGKDPDGQFRNGGVSAQTNELMREVYDPYMLMLSEYHEAMEQRSVDIAQGWDTASTATSYGIWAAEGVFTAVSGGAYAGVRSVLTPAVEGGVGKILSNAADNAIQGNFEQHVLAALVAGTPRNPGVEPVTVQDPTARPGESAPPGDRTVEVQPILDGSPPADGLSDAEAVIQELFVKIFTDFDGALRDGRSPAR